ncbi:RadC family protein [Xanthomonas sp. NCPPB 1325]|uniref:JAB domain-containing protein n=1 Tax=Xanthomonas sp. NCPPB 1325 TaxID=487529 RepID=UPI003556EB38
MPVETRTCAPSDGRPAPSQEVIRARDDKIFARALRILEQRACEPGPRLSDVSKGGAFFRLRLGGEIREHFEVAFLDNQHRLIGVERLFSGSVEGAEVHARIVVQRALALNAAAVIVAHNHRSGHTEPSAADRAVTVQLKTVLQLVEIRMLDHFVVTARQAVSMATRGWV